MCPVVTGLRKEQRSQTETDRQREREREREIERERRDRQTERERGERERERRGEEEKREKREERRREEKRREEKSSEALKVVNEPQWEKVQENAGKRRRGVLTEACLIPFHFHSPLLPVARPKEKESARPSIPF